MKSQSEIISEFHEEQNMSYQNLWKAAKVFGGKSTALNSHLKTKIGLILITLSNYKN